MKKSHVVILLVVVAAFFGRPGACTHEAKIATEAAALLRLNPQADAYNVASTLVLSNYLEVTDYYLFTIGRVRGELLTIGLPKYVYVYNKTLIFKYFLQ